jgi:hypothetical protein
LGTLWLMQLNFDLKILSVCLHYLYKFVRLVMAFRVSKLIAFVIAIHATYAHNVTNFTILVLIQIAVVKCVFDVGRCPSWVNLADLATYVLQAH